MAQPALPWLTRLCALYPKHAPGIQTCTVEPHSNGAMVSMTVHHGTVQLLLRPKGEGNCYIETASLAVSLQPVPEGSALHPADAEGIARPFIEVLRRADKGQIVLTPARSKSSGGPAAELAFDPEAVAAAREALAAEIHWASFIGYKAVVTEDLYPHVNPLGWVLDQNAILDGWRSAVERINDGTAPDKLGLYVHMPFCTVACTFCYCGKTDKFNRGMMESYLDRLHEEVAMFAPIFSDSTFTSVYFGGGTPSLLTPPAMKRLFADMYEAFHVPEGTQVIFEGNPDSLSESKIEVLANEGRVTRLTIGVQTLDDDVQKIVRRFNKPEQVADAIAAARKHGITHVNCDVMAGMPLQTLDSFKRDVEYLFSLEPDSLHLNGYRPLPRTALGSASEPMTDEEIELRNAMLEWGTEFLTSQGHVDKSGQGQRRTRNAANIQEYDLRRQNSSLLGLGYPARAHSFAGHYYAPDTKPGFDAGLQQEATQSRVWRGVEVDDLEEQHKYLVNNFRTGFERAEFEAIFGTDPYGVAPEAFDKLEACGLITVDDERIRTYVDSPTADFTFRSFLYSPKHMARAREVWGHEYDPDEDYTRLLLGLTESAG